MGTDTHLRTHDPRSVIGKDIIIVLPVVFLRKSEILSTYQWAFGGGGGRGRNLLMCSYIYRSQFKQSDTSEALCLGPLPGFVSGAVEGGDICPGDTIDQRLDTENNNKKHLEKKMPTKGTLVICCS